jgi:hypothetical protein
MRRGTHDHAHVAESDGEKIFLSRCPKARRAERQTSAQPVRAGWPCQYDMSPGGAAPNHPKTYRGIPIDTVLLQHVAEIRSRGWANAHALTLQGPEGRTLNVSPAREGWVARHLDVSPGGAAPNVVVFSRADEPLIRQTFTSTSFTAQKTAATSFLRRSEPRLYSFLAELGREDRIPVIASGGMPNHSHLLILLPPTKNLHRSLLQGRLATHLPAACRSPRGLCRSGRPSCRRAGSSGGGGRSVRR